MDKVRVIEIKKSVFESNDIEADKLRSELKEKGIFLLNLMSSPGSGKTTTLTRTIEDLQQDFKIGVMEADIDSDVDAPKSIISSGFCSAFSTEDKFVFCTLPKPFTFISVIIISPFLNL